jgi:hypothetical protein
MHDGNFWKFNLFLERESLSDIEAHSIKVYSGLYYRLLREHHLLKLLCMRSHYCNFRSTENAPDLLSVYRYTFLQTCFFTSYSSQPATTYVLVVVMILGFCSLSVRLIIDPVNELEQQVQTLTVAYHNITRQREECHDMGP